MPADFWSLNVSRQTQNHIPKFLALVEIINNSNSLGIDMPIIKNQKTIELVKVSEQFEILTFSEFIGISPEDFYTLNTGFTKWASPPVKNIEIYLPIELVETFQASQTSYFENYQMRWVTHKVQRGDSLWKIASRYDVGVDDLKLVNSLSKDLLFLDQVIPARTFGWRQHEETLRSKGLIQGVSQDNSIIIEDDGSCETPLRHPLEPGFHKILDLIGDLTLCGFSNRISGHWRRHQKTSCMKKYS